jgi:hypothetical protein
MKRYTVRATICSLVAVVGGFLAYGSAFCYWLSAHPHYGQWYRGAGGAGALGLAFLALMAFVAVPMTWLRFGGK